MFRPKRAPVKLSDEAVRKLPRWQLITLIALIALGAFFVSDLWTLRELEAQALAVSMVHGAFSDALFPYFGSTPAIDANPLSDWVNALALWGFSTDGHGPFSATMVMRAIANVWLLLTLVLLWIATRAFASTEGVQPIAFPLGGEAQRTDYSRACADVAILLFLGTFGLLTRRHEAVADSLLLVSGALNLYAMSVSLTRPKTGASWAGVAVAMSFLGGTVYTGLVTFLANTLIFLRVRHFGDDRFLRVGVMMGVAGFLASLWPALAFSVDTPRAIAYFGPWCQQQVLALTTFDIDNLTWFARNALWYLCPLWPLAIVAVVRWNKQRKLAALRIPALIVGFELLLSFMLDAQTANRTFLEFIPALALLSTFGLMTLRGRHRALLDWFALSVSTLALLTGWAYWGAWLTQFAPKMAQSIHQLAPGALPTFDWGFGLAVLATTLLLILFAWRFTHRPPFVWSGAWLAASGFGMTMTVWIGLFHTAVDVNRSYQPVVAHIKAAYTALGGTHNTCARAIGVTPGLQAYLAQQTGLPIVSANTPCAIRLVRIKSSKGTLPSGALGPFARPHTQEFFYLSTEH